MVKSECQRGYREIFMEVVIYILFG